MQKALIKIGMLCELANVIGIPGAVKLVMQLLTGRGTFPVTVPGYPHPIFIRKGTTDRAVLFAILIEGEYRNADYTKVPTTIVDAGANIGLTSVYFSNRFPQARILAIEPVQGNFDVLAKNVAAYPNVQVFHGAVWPNQASLEISNPGSGSDSFILQASDGEPGEPFPVITMPQVMDMMGGSIDLLKMDIEGAEREVFSAGNLDWLAAVNAIAIETHDRTAPGSSRAVYTAIANYSYRQFFGDKPFYVIKD